MSEQTIIQLGPLTVLHQDARIPTESGAYILRIQQPDGTFQEVGLADGLPGHPILVPPLQ